jgi:DNA modification methylase
LTGIGFDNEMSPRRKTWFAINGTLETIDFPGPSYFRFPQELADKVIDRFCPKGGSVLDPFVGFGTTLVAAQNQGRWGIGFEHDRERMEFARRRVEPPSQVIFDSVWNIADHNLPKFDLVLTSPPYSSFHGPQQDSAEKYIADFERMFCSLAPLMKVESWLIVEISNVRGDRGVTPVAFLATIALMKHFRFWGEEIRCNTGGEIAGPGYDHSYLLLFRPKAVVEI